MRVIYKVISNNIKECLGFSWCYQHQLDSVKEIFNRFNNKIIVME